MNKTLVMPVLMKKEDKRKVQNTNNGNELSLFTQIK